MKLYSKIILTISLITQSFFLYGGELVLTGVYHGSNLYVQNPHDSKQNYCVQDIYVNGKKHMATPQASVFTIDLSSIGMDTPVKIEIYHGNDCEPKVINPNAIRVKDEFQFAFINIDGQVLHWQAKGEKKLGKYFIEKFEHNNWDIELAISGKGDPKDNEYKVPIEHHAGSNKYRVKYLEVSGRSYYSGEVNYESERETVVFYPKKVSTTLSFSREIDYEIRDAYGNKVLVGRAQEVNCSNLKSGLYYISFDNRTEKFFKK